MGNVFEAQIIQIIDLSLHFTCPQMGKQAVAQLASGVYFSFLGCLLKMVNKIWCSQASCSPWVIPWGPFGQIWVDVQVSLQGHSCVMIQTARAGWPFQLMLAGSGLCREDNSSEWQLKKRKEEEEIKNQINKTQVEKGDFNIKGNKRYERWREVFDDLDLFGGLLPLPLDSPVCILGKTEGNILTDFCQVKDA